MKRHLKNTAWSLAAGLALLGPLAAHSYTHHFHFASNCTDVKKGVPYKMNIELHTVSKLCSNKQGWGISMAGTYTVESGGVCLVDSITLLKNDGPPQTRLNWRQSVGVVGSNWLVNCMDEGIGAYSVGIHRCDSDWKKCET